MNKDECLQNQYRLCYAASHNATKDGLVKLLAKLTTQRTDLVQAWREGGKQDKDWLPITVLDGVIDKQEQIIIWMEEI